MNNKISIQPISVWNNGSKTGTGFVVTNVNYDAAGVSTGFYNIVDASDNVIFSSTIMATAEQTASWTDDQAFYRVLAQNAGLLLA